MHSPTRKGLTGPRRRVKGRRLWIPVLLFLVAVLALVALPWRPEPTLKNPSQVREGSILTNITHDASVLAVPAAGDRCTPLPLIHEEPLPLRSDLLEHFREVYFSGSCLRRGQNLNPRCQTGPTAETFKAMRWRPDDVRAATRAYVADNVLVSVVTGNLDHHRRVKLAQCTWMAHVPAANLFFVTDSLRVPQANGGHTATAPVQEGLAQEDGRLYRHGTWYATQDAPRRSLSGAFLRKIAGVRISGGFARSVGWQHAQLRFFEALGVMFERTVGRMDGPDHHLYRWSTVLDDDTTVHLDGLAVTLHRSNLRHLFGMDSALWWYRYATAHSDTDTDTDTGGGSEGEETAGPRAEPRHLCSARRAAEQAWSSRCHRIAADNDGLAAGGSLARRLHRGAFSLGECEAFPARMADLVAQFAAAEKLFRRSPGRTGGVSANDTVARVRSAVSEPPRELAEALSSLCANALLFLDDPPAPSPVTPWGSSASDDGRLASVVPLPSAEELRLLEGLWRSSNELLRPGWVQLFLLPPVNHPNEVVSGAGHYFSANAFYRHVMRPMVDPAPGPAVGRGSGPPQLQIALPPPSSYAFVKPCVSRELRSGLASDEAMARCLPELGVLREQLPVFTDLVAGDLLGVVRDSQRATISLGNGGDDGYEYDDAARVPSDVPFRCQSRLLPRRCYSSGNDLASAVRHGPESLAAARWAHYTSASLVLWATAHVKEEVSDPFHGLTLSGRIGTDDLPRVASTLPEWFRRLAAYRARLYYEAVYLPASVEYTAGEADGVSERAVAAQLLSVLGTEHRLVPSHEWSWGQYQAEERCLRYFLTWTSHCNGPAGDHVC